jgi:hypothetical protein
MIVFAIWEFRWIAFDRPIIGEEGGAADLA